jgi:hypothetical protein
MRPIIVRFTLTEEEKKLLRRYLRVVGGYRSSLRLALEERGLSILMDARDYERENPPRHERGVDTGGIMAAYEHNVGPTHRAGRRADL